MANDPVSLWELALGFVGSVGSAVFTAWKLLNARFADLEREVQEHVEMDIGVHTRHSEQLSQLNDRVSPQVWTNAENIVRLQATSEEKLRRLNDLEERLEKVQTKYDTVMETLASVMLKIGK